MTEYKLKGRRVMKGIKQSDLAKQLGITPQHLNRIEKGLAEPRRDQMIRIAKILGCSVTELFFEE